MVRDGDASANPRVGLCDLSQDVLRHILDALPVRAWVRLYDTCRGLRLVLSERALWTRRRGWHAAIEWIEYDPVPRLCSASHVVEVDELTNLYRCFVLTPWTRFESRTRFRGNSEVRWRSEMRTRAVYIHRDRLVFLVAEDEIG